MTSFNPARSALGLDVGAKRLGVAVANLGVRFANPLTTLTEPDTFIADIIRLIRQEDAEVVVVGLPRGLEGQVTAQTARVQQLAAALQAAITDAGLQTTIAWTDEALTSVQAEAELAARSGAGYAKTAVDALAATYILNDFLQENVR